MNIEEAIETTWDYVIIGTGVGGGTLGASLVAKGKKVLFIEKGLSDRFVKGQFPEPQMKSFEKPTSSDLDLLKRHGRYTETVVDESFSPPRPFIPLLGQGLGGSSLLYGAAMERFYPEDFSATQYFKNQTESSTVDWPLGYKDLETYYTQAEDLYDVHGGVDPLRLPFQNKDLRGAKLSKEGEDLSTRFKSLGLHPYRLPVGHKPRNISSCKGCQAFICECDDKADSGSVAVRPALKSNNAQLLAECEVVHIEGSAERVLYVEVLYQQKKYKIIAHRYILAAGVLNTTKLLLRSTNTQWPEGLGNSSRMVGKNLCRHYMDLVMIHHPPASAEGVFEKELAWNDFYFFKDKKLGTVQSLGNPPSFETTLHEMYAEFGAGGSWTDRVYYQIVKSSGRRVIDYLFSRRMCLAVIMEDASYETNRLYLSSAGDLAMHYKIHSAEKERLSEFRKLILGKLKPLHPQLHRQAENNQRLAHASGTCRMGLDPRQSVLNVENRMHDLENLYVVDASFFPSSAGINPALTIAANALRVADLLVK